MLYDPNDATSGKGKTMETIKMPVIARGRGQSMPSFEGKGNAIHDITVVDTCHFTFVDLRNEQHQG